MPALPSAPYRRPLRAAAIRHRAQLPALVKTPPRHADAPTAMHDFLVANPRPDLTAHPLEPVRGECMR